MLGELRDCGLELHQRLTNAFDLLRRQRAFLHPPERLTFHQLTIELDQGQHELHHRAAYVFRLGVPAARRGPFIEPGFEFSSHQLELFEVVAHAKAYAGEGPLTRTRT